VALVVVGAVLVVLGFGQRRQRQTSRMWLATNIREVRRWPNQPRTAVVAVIAWTVLFGAIVGWDLVSFAYQTHMLPTLSYYIGRLTRHQLGRGAIFALWLGLGAYLALGWRTGWRRP
jgi:polyferredoxin